jgi:hypothetical protein
MQGIDDMVEGTIHALENLEEDNLHKGGNLLLQVVSEMFHQIGNNGKALRKYHFFLGKGIME